MSLFSKQTFVLFYVHSVVDNGMDIFQRGNECYYYSCIYILNDQFVSSTPEDFHQILSVRMESLNCFFQIILSFHKT